jgi:hypothetical protein
MFNKKGLITVEKNGVNDEHFWIPSLLVVVMTFQMKMMFSG